MQAKFDKKTHYVQGIKVAYLNVLNDIFVRTDSYIEIHGKLSKLLKNVKSDKRLGSEDKQHILLSISASLLQGGNFSLLASTFILIPNHLINNHIKLNLGKAHRFAAQNLSIEEADACAGAFVDGRKHDLPHHIRMAFEFLSDTTHADISDIALLSIAEIYQFIASKLSVDKYQDGSYQALLHFAQETLSLIKNKRSADYLLSAAACYYRLDQYKQALELYTQVLTTNYADKRGVGVYIYELRRLIQSQEQLQVASSNVYPSGTMFTSTAESSSATMGSNVCGSTAPYDYQQINNLLFHASVLEFNGQYEEAHSIYYYLMSVKPSVETQQNMQRCGWHINALNVQQAEVQQRYAGEETAGKLSL